MQRPPHKTSTHRFEFVDPFILSHIDGTGVGRQLHKSSNEENGNFKSSIFLFVDLSSFFIFQWIFLSRVLYFWMRLKGTRRKIEASVYNVRYNFNVGSFRALNYWSWSRWVWVIVSVCECLCVFVCVCVCVSDGREVCGCMAGCKCKYASVRVLWVWVTSKNQEDLIWRVFCIAHPRDTSKMS